VPDLTLRLHREGHLVANHSYDHPRRLDPAGWREQILRTEQLIRDARVPPAPFFRPPHGQVSPALLELCHELGYSLVLYTLLSSDWAQPGVETVVSQAIHRVAPGGVVVLHDAGGNRKQTVEALPGIIRGLRRRGYRLVTLDRLLGPDPRPVRCARPGRPIPAPD
ncbi:MAG: polysaccharide deacetylase family protein, partial [Deltaproteobacteria bacterium]|nr:polysaccharide deacetylase family protein [Deltaproteobacteria bacterium]